jgi:hypothetical protein
LDHHPLSLLLVVEIVEMEMEMEKRDNPERVEENEPIKAVTNRCVAFASPSPSNGHRRRSLPRN